MSNTVALAIPELIGSNYSKWKSTMTAYLCFSRAWGIVSGQNERLAETYSESGSDHVETTSTELKKEIHEVFEKDEIEKQYGTPHVAGIFGIFKEAINFELREDADPAMPIANLQSIFARLDGSGLKLTDQIQAMILLAALPCLAGILTLNASSNVIET
ncbi:hypothetical protein FB446DRAFT_784410 [Lentinula raphanica]|nr:hypothetical protein FB446DRAFT_784410 [Lentinula raphanica]